MDPSHIPWSEGFRNPLWEMLPETLDPRILSTSHHTTCGAVQRVLGWAGLVPQPGFTM